MNTAQTEKCWIVEGMFCAHCETRIQRALSRLPGVSAQASALEETVRVRFDPMQTSDAEIVKTIAAEGYTVIGLLTPGKKRKALGKTHLGGIGLLCVAALFLLANVLGVQWLPRIDGGMSYAMLFTAGLLTSLHCVAMCGGINLSQTLKRPAGKPLIPSILYNAGRVAAYTLIGGIAGALGSALPIPKGFTTAISLLAGAFMIIWGLGALGFFPFLRKLSFRLPRSLEMLRVKAAGYGPFAIGLLNGLMPCGPLQSMQLYALGTGSFAAGALSMLAFSLGTAPLMFGLGALGSLLSAKSTTRMLKAGAVLVVALGVITLGRQASLISIRSEAPPAQIIAGSPEIPSATDAPIAEDTVQHIASDLSRRGYPDITVQSGVPVIWTLHADARSLNGCNEVMEIPEYGLEVALHEGDNVITFTPGPAGTVHYTCWMGMLDGTIQIVG